MELQRNKLDEKTLTQYLTLLNDYNIKLSSPNHTAMMWLTRVNAKSELKMAITKLEEFHKQNFEAIE